MTNTHRGKLVTACGSDGNVVFGIVAKFFLIPLSTR